jgi:hypothetical protein
MTTNILITTIVAAALASAIVVTLFSIVVRINAVVVL